MATPVELFVELKVAWMLERAPHAWRFGATILVQWNLV